MHPRDDLAEEHAGRRAGAAQRGACGQQQEHAEDRHLRAETAGEAGREGGEQAEAKHRDGGREAREPRPEPEVGQEVRQHGRKAGEHRAEVERDQHQSEPEHDPGERASPAPDGRRLGGNGPLGRGSVGGAQGIFGRRSVEQQGGNDGPRPIVAGRAGRMRHPPWMRCGLSVRLPPVNPVIFLEWRGPPRLRLRQGLAFPRVVSHGANPCRRLRVARPGRLSCHPRPPISMKRSPAPAASDDDVRPPDFHARRDLSCA